MLTLGLTNQAMVKAVAEMDKEDTAINTISKDANFLFISARPPIDDIEIEEEVVNGANVLVVDFL